MWKYKLFKKKKSNILPFGACSPLGEEGASSKLCRAGLISLCRAGCWPVSWSWSKAGAGRILGGFSCFRFIYLFMFRAAFGSPFSGLLSTAQVEIEAWILVHGLAFDTWQRALMGCGCCSGLALAPSVLRGHAAVGSDGRAGMGSVYERMPFREREGVRRARSILRNFCFCAEHVRW